MKALTTWVVVLVKDFDSAKQRLSPALGAKSRRALARSNARLAVRAAAPGDHVLVVTGAEEVAEMAASWGADILLEPREEGQNVAARRGIALLQHLVGNQRECAVPFRPPGLALTQRQQQSGASRADHDNKTEQPHSPSQAFSPVLR